MDPAANTNQRLPPLTLPGEYPYVRMYQFRDGSWTRQDEYPGNEGYARGHIKGTFYELTPLGGHKALTAGPGHEYVANGLSTTVDKNHHNKVGGSTVDHVTSDHYSEHGRDKMHAIGGDKIHAVGGLEFKHATHGTQVTSTGDHVSDHNDGHHHINIAGDHVRYVGGVKYDSVGGEYGIYLPNGNMDIKLDKGKLQINCASDIIINSTSSITLKVGQSSIIVNTTGITIKGPMVTVNASSNNVSITAEQEVITMGSAGTLVQGGGASAPPTTFI